MYSNFFGTSACSGVVFPTAGKLGGFRMARDLQRSRKPALVAPHLTCFSFACKGLALRHPVFHTACQDKLIHFFGCICLAFLQCAQSNKAGSGGAGAGIECGGVFPSQAQPACRPDPDF